MQIKKEHIKKAVGKAEHDRQAMEFIQSTTPNFPDWIVICAFYSALHFVEAFLQSKGHAPSKSHAERAGNLRLEDPGNEFGGIYFRLQQHGHNARYNCSFDAHPWVPGAVADLDQIQRSVMKHLRDAGMV